MGVVPIFPRILNRGGKPGDCHHLRLTTGGALTRLPSKWMAVPRFPPKEFEMIKGLAHICLSATDLDAVQSFYCSGLGFKKGFDFIREGRVIGFYLEAAPGSYIEVFAGGEIDLAAHSPIQHFCLEVDDIDETGRRLAENGYEASEKMLGADQTWQMWTTDPSGVRIEFHQYTDKSFQITHEDCVVD